MQSLLFTQWMWLIIAAVLLLLELMLPGTFFLWLGLAAALVGLSVWTLVLPMPLQLVLFALFSVLAVFVGRRFQRQPGDTDDLINQGPAALVGERVEVVAAISHGKGRVAVGDSSWIAKGPDLPKGAVARVVGHEGSQLLVEAE